MLLLALTFLSAAFTRAGTLGGERFNRRGGPTGEGEERGSVHTRGSGGAHAQTSQEAPPCQPPSREQMVHSHQGERPMLHTSHLNEITVF